MCEEMTSRVTTSLDSKALLRLDQYREKYFILEGKVSFTVE